MIVDKIKNPEEELRNAFRLFDKNGDGFISVDELRTIITQLGDKLSEEEADELFAKADINHDGKLNYEGTFLFLTI